jgi:Sec-independent protein secretion pathway component TatC
MPSRLLVKAAVKEDRKSVCRSSRFVFITSLMFLGGAAFAYKYTFNLIGDILFKEATEAGLWTNLHIDSYPDLFLYTLLLTRATLELPVRSTSWRDSGS